MTALRSDQNGSLEPFFSRDCDDADAQQTYAPVGSCVAIYLGYRLFILGVTGQASLSVESKTVSAQLINAAPGLFFAIGGLTTLGIKYLQRCRNGFSPEGIESAKAGHI
jgi:hypothetical protein